MASDFFYHGTVVWVDSVRIAMAIPFNSTVLLRVACLTAALLLPCSRRRNSQRLVAMWSFRPALILACAWIFLLAARCQWHRPWGRALPAMQLGLLGVEPARGGRRDPRGGRRLARPLARVARCLWLWVWPCRRTDTEAGATAVDTACRLHLPPATCPLALAQNASSKHNTFRLVTHAVH